MRLRWKKKPRETGMKSAFSGPRGSMLHDGKIVYASVAFRRDFCRVGWYWTACVVGEFKTTCNEPCEEEAKAKAQAMAFVKKRLAETPEACRNAGAKQMKVWVTKYAMSGKGVIHYEDAKSSHVNTGSALCLHEDEWHTTPEASVAIAEEMRTKKIASLKKQIAKFKAMTFSAEDV